VCVGGAATWCLSWTHELTPPLRPFLVLCYSWLPVMGPLFFGSRAGDILPAPVTGELARKYLEGTPLC